MRRSEFEEELQSLIKAIWGTGEAQAPKNRLLAFYDEIHRELGYTASLRESLSLVTREKVQTQVQLEEREEELRILRRKDDDE